MINEDDFLEDILAMVSYEDFKDYVTNTDEFQIRILEDMPHVQEFSKRYQLVEVGITIENGPAEPAYTFADGIGMHYTREGLINSLK